MARDNKTKNATDKTTPSIPTEKERREERINAAGRLAAGVAHKMNNILGPLIAYPDLILSELPKDSELWEDINLIKQSAERATDVVADLMTIGRKGHYQRKSLNPNEIIESFFNIEQYQNLTTEFPSIIVKTELADDLIFTNTSESILHKALMSLIYNSYEAMPDGGNLTIRTFNQHIEGVIEAYHEIAEGDYSVIQFEDDGEGLSEEELSHIFEPFFMWERDRKGGTGFGLALVWGVVADHSGFVDIKSELGKGTIVTLYLPITDEHIEIPKEMSVEVHGDQKILIVDDVEAQRNLATRLLTTLGYKVDSVSNGKKAVKYLRENEVDLVLLDMIMERDFDGYDTYKEIISFKPGQRAIIASELAETQRIRDAMDLGVGEYLQKPYTIDKLGMAVLNVLDAD